MILSRLARWLAPATGSRRSVRRAQQLHVTPLEDRIAAAVTSFTPVPFAVSPSNQVLVNPAAPGYPVSIWPWAPGEYLVCNYGALTLLDATTGSATTLSAPPGVAQWVPTGIAVSPVNHHLFLANYKGGNVLEMTLTNDQLSLVQDYTDPLMKGPEGISVSSDGQHFAVADFDGNRVFYFATGGAALWSQPLGFAHSVSISGDAIYATSLLAPDVVKYDLAGNLVAETGQFGWGPDEYLWPTSVFATADEVIVSDAETGMISFLSPSLDFQSRFGGNGPGLDLFNMPYATILDQGNLVICDTYKARILIFAGDSCAEMLSRYPIPNVPELPLDTKEYDNYVDQGSATSIQIPGLDATTWYNTEGQFSLTTDGSRTADYPQFMDNLVKFPWSVSVTYQGQTYVVVGQTGGFGGLYVIDQNGRAFRSYATNPTFGIYDPFWDVDGQLVDNYGQPVDLTSTLHDAVAAFQQQDLLLQQRVDPIEAMREALFPAWPQATFAATLPSLFLTAAGQQFLTSFTADDSVAGMQRARAAFYAALPGQSRVEMSDVLLVDMLTRSLAVVDGIPTLTHVSPLPLGLLQVQGTGFQPGALVRWNGAALKTTYLSETQLEVSVPALDSTGGTGSITVVNPGGAMSDSEPLTLEGAGPPPALGPNPSAGQTTSVNALSGPGPDNSSTSAPSGRALAAQVIFLNLPSAYRAGRDLAPLRLQVLDTLGRPVGADILASFHFRSRHVSFWILRRTDARGAIRVPPIWLRGDGRYTLTVRVHGLRTTYCGNLAEVHAGL